jgi:hypothetical protein
MFSNIPRTGTDSLGHHKDRSNRDQLIATHLQVFYHASMMSIIHIVEFDILEEITNLDKRD